jgi:hypothetical protein
LGAVLWAAGFFGVVAVVVVVAVVAVVAATGVEVVFEPLPQPASASAASVVVISARFMNPAPVVARLPVPRVQDT